MNLPRLLFLSVALCVIPFSALAEDSRPQNLIRMDLYQEGYRADQASDYVKALEKLSAFKKVNNAPACGSHNFRRDSFSRFAGGQVKTAHAED
jgi:hypothetical protein